MNGRGILHGKRVLLAEDEDATRRAMATFLQSLGADVIETVDGGRMLVAIAAQYKDGRRPEDIDLVITDVRMPVVRGLDVFKGLRAAGWLTPVIVATAFDTPEVREVVERFGAVLLLKPIDLGELEDVIRKLIDDPSRTFHSALPPSR